jgi:hypothetical protein
VIVDPVSKQLDQYTGGDKRSLLQLLSQLRQGVNHADASFTSIYNVLDYGAEGDGITDDTAAFQAAHDAMSVFGGIVFAPAGTYAIGGTVTFSKPMTFMGVGIGSTIIKATVGTGDVFLMTGARQRLTGFQIQAGVPQTADAYVHYSSTASGQMIDHFYLDGWFRGILWDGIARLYADRGYLFNGVTNTGFGILINAGNDFRLAFLSMDGPAPQLSQAGIGMSIQNATNVVVQSCVILHHTNGIASTPGNGQALLNVEILDCLIDGCGTRGIILRPVVASTGSIARVRIADCTMSNSITQHGIILDSRGGTMNSVDIVNCQCMNNVLDGIQLLGIGNAKDVQVLGGEYSNNRDGIRFGDGAVGVTDFSVIGIRGTGNTGYAVNVSVAACTNYRVLDNDGRGNGIANIFDAGVAPKVVANNL